jgi:hypothetical protein
MMTLSVLVTASSETRIWLDKIKAKTLLEIPLAEYYNKKYWAIFKTLPRIEILLT